jgi:branched-chain amino acid aminotransferase
MLRLAQHFRRLEESSRLQGKPGHIDDAATGRALGEALTQAARTPGWAAPEARFRLTYAQPRLFISIEPFTPYPAALYEHGVRCATVSLHRDNPHAKSTTFIASAADAYKSLPEGTHEGLMLAPDGAVLEGLSSNFFAIQNSVLHTEEARVLIGVTRSLVLEVAKAVLPVSTEAMAFSQLRHVDECFITSVSREILPVVQIDLLKIGDGKPGPFTRRLMAGFADMVARESAPLGSAA